MKLELTFSQEKNLLIKKIREIGFEEVLDALERDKILDDISNPNKALYPNQRVLILEIDEYAYAVPYIISLKKKEIFLKTVYPSRKFTKKYLRK